MITLDCRNISKRKMREKRLNLRRNFAVYLSLTQVVSKSNNYYLFFTKV
jgi:hypothetical protein